MIYWISFIVVFILLSILHLYLVSRNKNNNNQNKTVLQIQISKENEKTPLTAESIFSSIYSNHSDWFFAWFFWKNPPKFSFEIATIDQKIYFYVHCESRYKKLLKNQLFAQYPDIEITEIEDYTVNNNCDNTVSAEITTTDPYIFPIKRHPEFNDSTTLTFYDPLSSITSAFAQLNATDEQLWAQIVISPASIKFRHRWIWCANKISWWFRTCIIALQRN